MKKFVVVPIFLLAGCMSSEIVTQPVNANFSSQQSRNAVIGMAQIELRTFQRSDGSRSELTGIPCTFSGRGFSGKATTPALVNLPHQANRSDPILFSCTYSGETKTKSIEAFNATQAGQTTSTTMVFGGGLLGALAGEVVAAQSAKRRDPKLDTWDYPDVSVSFTN